MSWEKLSKVADATANYTTYWQRCYGRLRNNTNSPHGASFFQYIPNFVWWKFVRSVMLLEYLHLIQRGISSRKQMAWLDFTDLSHMWSAHEKYFGHKTKCLSKSTAKYYPVTIIIVVLAKIRWNKLAEFNRNCVNKVVPKINRLKMKETCLSVHPTVCRFS